jgi:2-methylisocitrate lyase-like PEP mutase family enzyme
VTTFRAAMKAARDALSEISRSGTQKAILQKLMTREEFNKLIDYRSVERADRATAKKASRLSGCSSLTARSQVVHEP